jgi:hypothetical protein
MLGIAGLLGGRGLQEEETKWENDTRKKKRPAEGGGCSPASRGCALVKGSPHIEGEADKDTLGSLPVSACPELSPQGHSKFL